MRWWHWQVPTRKLFLTTSNEQNMKNWCYVYWKGWPKLVWKACKLRCWPRCFKKYSQGVHDGLNTYLSVFVVFTSTLGYFNCANLIFPFCSYNLQNLITCEGYADHAIERIKNAVNVRVPMAKAVYIWSQKQYIFGGKSSIYLVANAALIWLFYDCSSASSDERFWL